MSTPSRSLLITPIVTPKNCASRSGRVSRLQTPSLATVPKLEKKSSRQSTPLAQRYRRHGSISLQTPPNITVWEPTYDEILARVTEDAKVVSDEELPEESVKERTAVSESPVTQFASVSPPTKTKLWQRRRTQYTDGRYTEEIPGLVARPKERRCNSSLDDIRMQDDVHRELAMTCRMFAKTLKGEVPAVEGNDPTSMRKRINRLRRDMSELCVKRDGFTEGSTGTALPSKAKTVMAANFSNGGTHHPSDEVDQQALGYPPVNRKEAARQAYQSLFDLNVTMLCKKGNIPEIPRSFTMNRNGMLKRRTDCDKGEFAPRIQVAMEKAQKKFAEMDRMLEEAEQAEGVIAGHSGEHNKKFLNKCSRRNVLPLDGPMKCMMATPGRVDLSHYRVGDNLLESLMPQISSAPDPIVVMNLQDNAIREKGGGALVELFQKSTILKTLTNLNLSHNRIGNFAIERMSDMINSNSVVASLDLSTNHLGNYGIGCFVESLGVNQCLTCLNLSNNGITEKGCDALSTMLRENSSVTDLNLSYNMIRRKAGADVMRALADNKTLNKLDMSWNGLGLAENGSRNKQSKTDVEMDGVAVLAHVLESNTQLTEVNLAHNGVEEQGAFALANVLPQNSTLTRLVLDLNPLGFQGGRAILAVVMDPQAPTREISLVNCSYCDLGCRCGALQAPEGDKKKCVCGFAKALKFNPDQPSGKYQLKLDKASDRSVVKTMLQLARSMEGDNIRSVKLNNQNWSDFNEDDPKLVIPETGVLDCEYVETKKIAMSKTVFHSESISGLQDTLQSLGPVPRLRVLQALSSQYTFETTQLSQIVDLFEFGEATIEAVAVLFGRCVDQKNVQAACEEIFEKKGMGEKAMTKLAAVLGPLFSFNRENACGHYRLDMASTHAHTVLRQLVTISVHHAQERCAAGLFDLSQHGNYECFRNETMDNGPIEIDSEDVSAKWVQLGTSFPILHKHKGILEFDFVPSTRPGGEVETISEKVMEKLYKKVRKLRKEPEQLARFLRWEAAEHYFAVKQVANLIDVAMTDEMRQEMLMIVWNRIVDEENIMQGLVVHLKEELQATLRRHIGPLKLFNPLRPIRQYTLNLAMRDERLVARFLLELAAKEYPETESGALGLQPAGTLDEQKGDDKPPVELKKVPDLWMEPPPEGGLPSLGIWCIMYDPPMVDLPLRPPKTAKTVADVDEAEESAEEEDEEEVFQKRKEATDAKHEPFRTMIATKLLGWSFPEPPTEAT